MADKKTRQIPPGRGDAPAQARNVRARAGRSPATKPRAYGLTRVSTQGQAERGMGLAAQRRRVQDFAREHGLALVEIVEERASGAVKEGEFSSIEHRPVLRALIERAETGEYEVLVVASFDRLSRDQIDAQVIKRWLGKHGVRCVSAAGEANGAEGAIAELIDRLLGAVHDFDRKRILERVSAGKAEKKALGRHVHGRAAFGYRSEHGVLEPVPELAEVVRRIFRDASQGDSPGRIARALTAAGIPSPEGAAWSAKAVSRILSNPAYAGERYGVKKAHAPIVSRRLFNAVQAVLQQRADEWARKRRRSS